MADTHSPPENLRINWLSLSFPGDLEKAFRESYFQNSLRQIRIAFLLGIFLYGIFGILDAWLVPEAKQELWFIRYAILIPGGLATFLFSFSHHFKKYMQISVAFMVTLGGFCIIAMIMIAPYPASYSYYAGLLLIFIYGYNFVKLRFWWASLAGWSIVIGYEIAAVWLNPTPIPVLINNNFFFLSANLMCMFICYSGEYHLRRNYLQAQSLEAEKKKVSAINQELEHRVRERTTQLVEANKELKQEISERKHSEKKRRYLEAQLSQAQKMEAIGTLAGGVAHDLNNILSGLVSYPELLLMDLAEESPLREPLLTIQESGQKAAAIVQDLLTLARRGVCVTDVIDLNQLLEEYLNSPENKKIIGYHPGIVVKTRLAQDAMNIMGSPVHLSKAIMNIVANAAEAMPNGGEILICTENRSIDKAIKGYDTIDEGDYVALTVADTGIGIPAEDIDRIFEPFYTKKTMGRSGTGLGMSVVWGTVKDHHGHIDVQSHLGEGTTFTLYFPVTREKIIQSTPDIPIAKYRGNGESILIVDDIKEQREIASGILKKLGYNVISVPSGEEALMYLKENSADLLVLDMIMNPGMDGLETYKKILQYHPEQKAVIASGFSESDRVKQMKDIGAGTYVKKPYSFEKIGIAVKDILTNSGTASGA